MINVGEASSTKGYDVTKAEIPNDLSETSLKMRPMASVRCIIIIYLLLYAVTTWNRQGDNRGTVSVTARELADSPERRHPGKDVLIARLFPSFGRALKLSTFMESQLSEKYPQGIPRGGGG